MGKRQYQFDMRAMHRMMVSFECDRLEQFIQDMHLSLISEYKQFEKYAGEQLERMSEEQAQYAMEAYAEDAHNLSVEDPRLLWQGVFISLYGLFEQQMNRLCRTVRVIATQRKIKRHSARKLPNSAIMIPGEACLRKSGIRISRSSRHWKQFSRLVEIRHTVAHNYGRVRREDKKLRSTIRRMKNITLEIDQIVFSNEFCQHTLRLVRSLLLSTINRIPMCLLSPQDR